ncbi:hypothetical protein KR767_03500 [Luteibacter anthropi]|uniref:hypothetical protein n=1 Tax=Luteibacter anthropi TaxID=564369 RepID=UPI0020328F00|nr:hypothetical protein [Luteibacter anthropi]URX63148.1 hypothetical protein KR767_03500 [Luteibacter anthropi]
MIVGLWEVGVALVLLVVNLLVYMSSYGRRCSLATGARMFSVLAFVAFSAGSFAVGHMATHGCLLPREVWPGMVFDVASAGLVGASLGAVWLWGCCGSDAPDDTVSL